MDDDERTNRSVSTGKKRGRRSSGGATKKTGAAAVAIQQQPTNSTKMNKKMKKRRASSYTQAEKERILAGAVADAKIAFEKHKAEVLSSLPDSLVSLFGQIGFSRWGKQTIPVLCLSPFAVPPGVVRSKWMKMYESLKQQKRLHEYTLLCYWYGSEDINNAYSFIPQKSFISFDKGAAKGLDKFPLKVQQKIDTKKGLMKDEKILIRAYQELAEDLNLDPSERKRGVVDFPEGYEQLSMSDVNELRFDDDDDDDDNDDDDEAEMDVTEPDFVGFHDDEKPQLEEEDELELETPHSDAASDGHDDSGVASKSEKGKKKKKGKKKRASISIAAKAIDFIDESDGELKPPKKKKGQLQEPEILDEKAQIAEDEPEAREERKVKTMKRKKRKAKELNDAEEEAPSLVVVDDRMQGETDKLKVEEVEGVEEDRSTAVGGAGDVAKRSGKKKGKKKKGVKLDTADEKEVVTDCLLAVAEHSNNKLEVAQELHETSSNGKRLANEKIAAESEVGFGESIADASVNLPEPEDHRTIDDEPTRFGAAVEGNEIIEKPADAEKEAIVDAPDVVVASTLSVDANQTKEAKDEADDIKDTDEQGMGKGDDDADANDDDFKDENEADLKDDDLDENTGVSSKKASKQSKKGKKRHQSNDDDRAAERQDQKPRDPKRAELRAFRHCEELYLPLFDEWEQDLRDGNLAAVERMLLRVMEVAEDFSATFMESYNLSQLMSDTKVKLKAEDIDLTQYSKLRELCKDIHKRKKKNVPTGYKPKKARNDMPDKVEDMQSKKEKDIVTDRQPTVQKKASVDDAPSQGRPNVSDVATPSEVNAHVPKHSGAGSKSSAPPREREVKPGSVAAPVPPKPKKFSLSGFMKPSRGDAGGTPSTLSQSNTTAAGRSSQQQQPRLPHWMTSQSPHKTDASAQDELRFFALQFLLQMAEQLPKSRGVHVEGMARALEEAIHIWSQDVKVPSASKKAPQDLYWMKVHAIVAAVCGKQGPSGTLMHLLMDGAFPDPRKLVQLSHDQLADSFEGRPVFL